MCNKMVDRLSNSSIKQNRSSGNKSPQSQNFVKSQNFTSKMRTPNQGRTSPKGSSSNSHQQKFSSPNHPLSAKKTSQGCQASGRGQAAAPTMSSPKNCPPRSSPQQVNFRRDRHQSVSSSISSGSSSRGSPSLCHSNSPSPVNSFASSTCYQAPMPESIPMPPCKWISSSPPPTSPSSMKMRTPSPMDPSKLLMNLLKVEA
jgi:hypothetical protein